MYDLLSDLLALVLLLLDVLDVLDLLAVRAVGLGHVRVDGLLWKKISYVVDSRYRIKAVKLNWLMYSILRCPMNC